MLSFESSHISQLPREAANVEKAQLSFERITVQIYSSYTGSIVKMRRSKMSKKSSVEKPKCNYFDSPVEEGTSLANPLNSPVQQLFSHPVDGELLTIINSCL